MTRKLNTLHALVLCSFLLCTFGANSQTDHNLTLADNYLKSQSIALNLTEADISDYLVSDNYTSRHNGVTHVYLLQRHQGIEVIGALNNFNILPEGRVMNMGNRFVANLASKVNTTQPSISPEDAVKAVISHFNIPTDKPLELLRQKSPHQFIYKKDGIALENINVQLKYQPVSEKEVKLVWQVSLYQRDAQHDWSASIDATTGKLIIHYDNVIHCNLDHMHTDCAKEYRSYTKPVEPKPNRTEVPCKSTNGALSEVVMEGTYNVLPLPVESPDHGHRELITNPADPIASPYGWHDIDGNDGHEYTITRGNNVHAYQDIVGSGRSLGDEPDGGDDLIFDFPFDTANYYPYSMRDAAVTNLFYWNNIIHDVWYQYGFDEVSGNFQVNNYANGGIGDDAVNAEALDGSGRNNANFRTRVDGIPGRMQMYYLAENFGAPNTDLPESFGFEYSIDEPAAIAGIDTFFLALFGDTLAGPFTGTIVQVDDGSGNPNDACEFLDNGDEVEGNIALIDKGNCDFDFQAWIAQFNGASGVIICNDDSPLIEMPSLGFGDQINIPAVMISKQSCDKIKLYLDQNVKVTIERDTNKIVIPLGPVGRDSDFDNSVIVHEYAHGISNRLTGGPNAANCLFSDPATEYNQQMGEGWSDWLALVMVVPESWGATAGKGMGTYFGFEPIDGPGIRNNPYSTDFSVNDHTYASYNDVNVNMAGFKPPHPVGEIWATMLWDLYWKFIDEYGYDTDLYYGTGGNNMAMQLVMDGMKLQPCSPTFIDGRDAIIRADSVNYDGIHTCMIWECFARRGLGYSAESFGNTVEEAFDPSPFCDPTLKMTLTGDITATQGQPVNYHVEIRNDIPDMDADIAYTDEAPPGMDYVAGSSTCGGGATDDIYSYVIEPLGSGHIANCEYQMYADPSAYSTIEFEDDLNLTTSKWSKTANIGSGIWTPNTENVHSGAGAVKSADSDMPCDRLLTLKDAVLIDGDKPGLVFWHHYLTVPESSGGVIEISTDDGVSWEDLGNHIIDNPYNGTIDIDPTSPISGRPSFTGNSKEYIRTIVDLTAYKDQMVKIRFRFGCNDGPGADGWYVDEIQIFDHITVVFNEACMTSPISDPICDEVTTIVFGSPTNTKEALPQSYVKLFPNPTTGMVELQWDAQVSQIASVNLVSIEGRQLGTWTVDPTSTSFSMDLSEFGKGIYLIQVMTDEAFVTKKVVVK